MNAFKDELNQEEEKQNNPDQNQELESSSEKEDFDVA